MIRIPGTDKIVFVPAHSGDYVVDMGNFPDVDASIRQEDKVVIGNWSDYSGSGTIGPTAVMTQGLQNENDFDLEAKEAGVNIDEFTDRGNRSSTVRQRNKLVYIEV
jgi:hypothetical protein